MACEIQASNEFELDDQRVVLIDTPGITFRDYMMMGDIKKFLAESYVQNIIAGL